MSREDQLRPKRSEPPAETAGEESFALDESQEKLFFY